MLGASFDTPAENKAFADAQHFAFRLLSDVDRTVGALYEVVRPAGHRYAEYPERMSFLIDPDGIIRTVYEVSDVASHASDVLTDLARLNAGSHE